MTTTILSPRAGQIDDIRREDESSGHNGSGYELDETEAFHRLVDRLVADGDDRARTAGRRARRTLAEMAPGHVRQPVLRMTRADIVFEASRACSSCHGQGGRMEDTSADGVIRQHWVTCGSCRGSGVQQ